MLSAPQYQSLKGKASELWQAESDAAEPRGDIFSIIMAIISAIMGACPKPPTAAELKATCNKPALYDKFIFNHYARQELGVREYRLHGEAVRNTAYNLGKSSNEELVEAACC